MSLLQQILPEAVGAEITRPDPERILAGDPVHTTWNIEDRDGLYCGIWQSTPGKWRVSYSEWEYVFIHAGLSVLTGADGHSVTLRAGDRYIIRPGFEGTWECLETTIKDYVIRI